MLVVSVISARGEKGIRLNPIIQVIVGIIFVFILLSILVTEVNTLIARATKLRGKNLRQSLNHIIEDPVIRAKIYTHPLIQLVKADPVPPTQRLSRADAEKIVKKPITAIDYIAPQTFVDVVLSTIKAESDQQLFGALLNVIDGMPSGPERRGLRAMVNRVITTGTGLQELRKALPYVKERRYRSALTDIVNQIDEEIGLLGLEPTTNVSLMAGIHQIENQNLRNALSTVMSSADNMAAARGNLESWFNTSMTRASAAYASKMKNLSIAVALCFALLLNIDTLRIAQTLWEDPARREQISSAASDLAQSGELQSPINSATEAGDEFRAYGAEVDPALADAVETGAAIAGQLQEIHELRLPIGWSFHDPTEQPSAYFGRSDPNNLWNYLPENNPEGWLSLLAAKFFGLAATVIATAQGAPFWFGIVNRILRR